MEKKLEFIESISIKQNPQKDLLISIQDEIEKRGVNKETIIELTKNLSVDQKKSLINLYKEQINDIKTSTERYKQNIIKIRKKLMIN